MVGIGRIRQWSATRTGGWSSALTLGWPSSRCIHVPHELIVGDAEMRIIGWLPVAPGAVPPHRRGPHRARPTAFTVRNVTLSFLFFFSSFPFFFFFFFFSFFFHVEQLGPRTALPLSIVVE